MGFVPLVVPALMPVFIAIEDQGAFVFSFKVHTLVCAVIRVFVGLVSSIDKLWCNLLVVALWLRLLGL